MATPPARRGIRGAAHRRTAVLVGALIVILGAGGAGAMATAGPTTVVPSTAPIAAGTLYFTRFRPPSVNRVEFSYRDSHLHLSTPTEVARVPGADGIATGPDGHLLVGGVHTGKIFSVDPSSGAAAAVPAGIAAAMHLSISPNGRTLYTAGEPGTLAALPLNPLGRGHEIPIHGATDAVTALAFGPNGQVLYTDSPPAGRGSIGLIDLATGETTRLFTDLTGAHGIVYDPWSRTYLVVGGDIALQISPDNLHHIESELALPGNRFDQAAVTGRGQVLIASNLGALVFVDYSKTGRIGDTADVVISRNLAHNLDDVAPLIGPGAPPVPTNAAVRVKVGLAAVLVALALLVGMLVVAWRSRRRTKPKRRTQRRPLPRWDRRRREPGSVLGRP